MPTDHKRIGAPENTVPYALFEKLTLKSYTEQLQEIVERDNKRLDGRTSDELRKIFFKTGIVTQAKGSAYVEVNNTKVIVSVYDPREIPNKTEYSLNGELYCEFKYAPFSCAKRRMHQQDNEEKYLSLIMKHALEPAVCLHEFPNFQVDVYALVLQNDGSAVSAAITCAGLALAHAGVPMFDIVTSVTLGIQGDLRFLDPTLEEERLCEIAIPSNEEKTEYGDHGFVIFALLSTHQQVSEFYQVGNLSLKGINESLDVLTAANKKIVPLIEKCLVKHVVKNLKKDDDS